MNPVISPLLNNDKLGGNVPDVTLYCKNVSDTANTLSVLIVPLNISPRLLGVTQTISPVISKLKLNEKLKLTLEILVFPVFLTLTLNE